MSKLRPWSVEERDAISCGDQLGRDWPDLASGRSPCSVDSHLHGHLHLGNLRARVGSLSRCTRRASRLSEDLELPLVGSTGKRNLVGTWDLET